MVWNAELDAGRPFDDACDALASAHPDHAELVHAWKRQDEMIAGEVAGTADVVRELRASGVPLYLLTNMPTDVFAARHAQYGVLHGFHGAVVSCGAGVLQPSPAAFQDVTSGLRRDPAGTPRNN